MAVSKKHAEVIKAWLEGEEVQVKGISEGSIWTTEPNPSFSSLFNYRIKPKEKVKKLVPFDESDVHGLVGKVIVSSSNERHCLITISSGVKGYPSVLVQGEWMNTAALLSRFKFTDGSPCGKYIEE